KKFIKGLGEVLFYSLGFWGLGVLAFRDKNLWLAAMVPMYLIGLFVGVWGATEHRYFLMAFPFLGLGVVYSLWRLLRGYFVLRASLIVFA
ncbi:MAG: hypothetical protein ACUVRD_08715, partial [Bacteroidia bacterium]